MPLFEKSLNQDGEKFTTLLASAESNYYKTPHSETSPVDAPKNNATLVTNDRNIWRERSFIQDITQTWLNKFVTFAATADQIRPENLCHLSDHEKAENLYQ
jgi:hypothetical protein